MEDGACCDRVSAGGSRRRAGSRLVLGVPGRRLLAPRPPAPRPPPGGREGCPPDGPGAGPEPQTAGGCDPPRVGTREEAPRAPGYGRRAAGLSGGGPARGSRRGWALPLLFFFPAWARRSGLRAGPVLVPAAPERVPLGGLLRERRSPAGRGPGPAQAVPPSSVAPAHPAAGEARRVPSAADRERSDKGFRSCGREKLGAAFLLCRSPPRAAGAGRRPPARPAERGGSVTAAAAAERSRWRRVRVRLPSPASRTPVLLRLGIGGSLFLLPAHHSQGFVEFQVPSSYYCMAAKGSRFPAPLSRAGS